MDKKPRKQYPKQENRSFGPKKQAKRTFVPKKKSPHEKVEISDGRIRLNKFIAHSGMCSRRDADEFIRTGLVMINDQIVTEMGYKVNTTDKVWFDGKVIKAEKPTYILLNKPKGFITTTTDEKARKTVMDLIEKASPYRVYPVGRLDRPTTGVLLFTNDGDLTNKLLHPSHGTKKIYHVTLDKALSHEDLQEIKNGIRFFEGVAQVDKISYIDGKNKNELGIEIHIGWNKIVRRIFKKLGYTVEKLDRVSFAGLTKKNLKRGEYRLLNSKEVGFLKML